MSNYFNNGFIMPIFKTKSRHNGESPAIFPNAQTACSCTSSCGDSNKYINTGTASASITFLVCSDVPEAIFVNAHAASN